MIRSPDTSKSPLNLPKVQGLNPSHFLTWAAEADQVQTVNTMVEFREKLRKDDDDHGLLTPTHFFLSSVSVSFLSVTFILLRHKLPVRPGQPSSSALTDKRQEAAARTGVRHYVNTQGFHFTSDIKSVRFNKSLDIDTDFSRLTVNFPGSPGSSLTMLWCGGTAGERAALTSA